MGDTPRWSRVVLKLSGEAFADKSGGGSIDGDVVFQVAREIADGRHHIVLAEGTPLEITMSAIVARGGQIVSVNPVRDTLEDVFLARVRETDRREVG